MSVQIDIQPGTLPRLAKAIEGIRLRLVNLEPVMRRQALLLAGLIDDSFQNSRSPLGKGWAPLAESTVERRRLGSSKPLVDTGQLRMASTAKAKGSSVVFGTSGAPANYARFHVAGSDKMHRSFLPVTEDGKKPDFSSGPAATWLEQTEKRVAHFLITGENLR